MKTLLLAVPALLLSLASACASPSAAPEPAKLPASKDHVVASGEPQSVADLVAGEGQSWAIQLDGALSCGKKPPTPLEIGAKALEKAGIKVADSRHVSDGKIHAMACGMPTGGVNAYLIAQSDLEAAKKLGFHDLSFLDAKQPSRRQGPRAGKPSTTKR